jgi:phage gp29-like protein
MTTKRTLTQADVNLLSKTFFTKNDTNSFARSLSETINKLLLKQEIRTYGKMDELEEKFEKKVEEVKSDLFEKIDPILKEVTTAREEGSIIENRLEALEDIHPEGKHIITSIS